MRLNTRSVLRKGSAFVALATAIAALCMPAGARAKAMKCIWTEKSECVPGSGCKPAKLGVWATVDLAAQNYQRCDRNGCDTYTAIVTVGPGAYSFVDMPGRGMMMKLGPRGQATEVVSIGNTVLISQGACR